MCFSATASITAGVVLGGIGLVTMAKVDAPEKRMLAMIPILFSIQQFSEAIVWKSMTTDSFTSWHQGAVYCFLLFAQVVWPAYISGSVLKAEREEKRKRWLEVLFASGLLISGFLLYCLVRYPVEASVREHHIFYDLRYPAYAILLMKIFYFLPTFVPPFLSSNRRIVTIGVVLVVSYLLSRLVFEKYVISVWCFFATTISLAVLYVVYPLQERGIPGYLMRMTKYKRYR